MDSYFTYHWADLEVNIVSNGKNSFESFSEGIGEGIGSMAQGIFGLIPMAICYVVCLAVFPAINSYHLLTTPLNYCFGFYYFTVIFPFKFGLSTYNYVSSSLTPYPNLNLVLGILATLVYACIYLWIWYQLIFPSENRRVISLGIFFTPAIVAIIVLLFRWLFAVR